MVEFKHRKIKSTKVVDVSYSRFQTLLHSFSLYDINK